MIILAHSANEFLCKIYLHPQKNVKDDIADCVLIFIGPESEWWNIILQDENSWNIRYKCKSGYVIFVRPQTGMGISEYLDLLSMAE